jgi:hypothetical protein
LRYTYIEFRLNYEMEVHDARKNWRNVPSQRRLQM